MIVGSFIPVSSIDGLEALIDELERRDCVIVLASGEITCFAGLSSTDARTEVDLATLSVLARLARASFEFVAAVVGFLRSELFPSLFITSASAFPTVENVKDCRIDVRVLRLADLAGLGDPTVVGSVDMVEESAQGTKFVNYRCYSLSSSVYSAAYVVAAAVVIVVLVVVVVVVVECRGCLEVLKSNSDQTRLNSTTF